MKKVIEAFADRFINHTGAYYQQWTNGSEYGYCAVYRAPTMHVITSHIQGDITISAPALDENGSGKWICFDSDKQDGNLHRLDSFLQYHHWQTIKEGARPGRDGHLWVLFDAPITGEHLLNLASTMLNLSGLSDVGIEIFPKQAKVSKLGSAARLPLGIHRKPGANNCRGWFNITQQNCHNRHDIESQLIWLAQQPSNDASMVIELAKQHAPVVLPPIKRQITTTYKGTINFKEIAQAALQQAQSIVSHWLPGGKGHIHYTALNPRRTDNHAGSFSINLQKGFWKDFATNDGGGDLISLVAYLDNCNQLEAAKKLASFIKHSDKL